MTIETLDLVKVAMPKAFNEDTTKAAMALVPNDTVIPLQATVQLIGALKRGKPFEQTVAAAANPWKLLARALSKLNAATIDTIVKEALEVSDEEHEAVKLAADQAIKKIIAETKRPMQGKITATLKVVLVS